MERLPRGDQRTLRAGQEDAAGAGPGLPRSSTASTRSSCCRSTSTGRATTSTPRSSHVIPALIRSASRRAAAGEPEVAVWGDGTPTREFLYVEDARRGHRAGGRALRRTRAGEPGQRLRDHASGIWPRRSHGRPASRGASCGTPPSPTASRAASSIRRAPSAASAFARPPRSTRGCGGRSSGSKRIA